MGAQGKQGGGGQPKPKRRRRKKAPSGERATPRAATAMAYLRGFGAAVALIASMALVWLLILYPSGRGDGDGRGVPVTIGPGLGPEQIAALLAQEGVLARPRLFAFWMWATGGAGHVVPGPHLLTDDASPRELLARLERRGGGETARVTFPEGWTRFDIARRLDDKHVTPLREFLDATTDRDLLRELGIEADSAEGFLFP